MMENYLKKTRAAFQIAVLHTDAFSGQRRIRVLNLGTPLHFINPNNFQNG